jgi:hypothetical protein
MRRPAKEESGRCFLIEPKKNLPAREQVQIITRKRKKREKTTQAVKATPHIN